MVHHHAKFSSSSCYGWSRDCMYEKFWGAGAPPLVGKSEFNPLTTFQGPDVQCHPVPNCWTTRWTMRIHGLVLL